MELTEANVTVAWIPNAVARECYCLGECLVATTFPQSGEFERKQPQALMSTQRWACFALITYHPGLRVLVVIY